MRSAIQRATRMALATTILFAASVASASEPVEGLIVKLRPSAARGVEASLTTRDIERLNRISGAKLAHGRAMSGGAHVLRLGKPVSYAEAQRLAARMAAVPEVEYAVPDRRVYPLQVPSDVYYSQQWGLGVPLVGQMGINAPAAWDISTGNSSIVVAVVDTGLVNHADIDRNILDTTGQVAPGYDFVTDDLTANDNEQGRDADPRDPGDAVTSAESASGPFAGCPVSNSSWHGTHVAGIVGALSNNATGVAGVAWNTRILPVRVMGKCGGVLSDILDGVRWAAGVPVGSLTNPNPAQVINLSLGGSGVCTAAEQAAINDVVNVGAVVVVAAGNSNVNVSTSAPANCANVIAVAATDRNGGRAVYSNFGSLIDIAAPGGAQVSANDSNGILSTLNTGLTGPSTDAYVFYQGTSMAAPHVAGVAALMLAVEPTLTPAQMEAMLRASARAFPSGSSCTAANCGAGLLDAHAALLLAQQNQAVIEVRVTDGSGAEPSDVLSFTIARIGTTMASLTVQYALSGSATAGADYAALSGSVTIPAGASTATVVVTPLDDSAVEGTETVTLTLQSSSTYVVGTPNSASVDLIDNDVPRLSDSGGGCTVSHTRDFDPLWLSLLLWPLWRRFRARQGKHG